jgi:hypothetical protein
MLRLTSSPAGRVARHALRDFFFGQQVDIAVDLVCEFAFDAVPAKEIANKVPKARP